MGYSYRELEDIYLYAGDSVCHVGPIEVLPGLFCGSESEILYSLRSGSNYDVLVPLNDLSGEVWKYGFRGEIMYYPIEDYSILPDEVLHEVADKIIKNTQEGKKVGLFCFGGHGRTGYVAAVVLGKLGFKNPIKHLWLNYCTKAIESNEQAKQISKVLDSPGLYRFFLEDYIC